MKSSAILTILISVLLLWSSSTHAKSPPSPPIILSPTPAPAPAPDPGFVNLTQLLTVAGPFHIFLNYLIQTKVIDTFQNQANNTEEGITIFVPKNGAFKALKKPSISNLTASQLKQLVLFHALPHYYSLSNFKNLSEASNINTFAGGQYTLNFSDASGTVHINSGWSKTKVSSSVWSTDPVAVYQVDKVLLPEAIFGADIPPTPAPAPAPEISPAAADTPGSSEADKGSSPAASQKNSSPRIVSGAWTCLIFAVSGGLALFL